MSLARLSILVLLGLLIITTTALPHRRTRKRNSDAGCYEWVSASDSYSSYKDYEDAGYGLVESDTTDENYFRYVCQVKFSDGAYAIGGFDADSSFKCAVVYNGAVVEVGSSYDKASEIYFLSVPNDKSYGWVMYKDLVDQQNGYSVIVAYDKDTVAGELCWNATSASKSDETSPPPPEWHERRSAGIVKRDSGYQPDWVKDSSYTPPSGGYTPDYAPPPYKPKPSYAPEPSYEPEPSPSYGAPQPSYTSPSQPSYPPKQDEYQYCGIGYGNKYTQNTIYFAWEGEAYQSTDTRTAIDVKILVCKA
ncbi:hypothetical protein HK104_003401, partial [Borealophlyctis nickersoniae]